MDKIHIRSYASELMPAEPDVGLPSTVWAIDDEGAEKFKQALRQQLLAEIEKRLREKETIHHDVVSGKLHGAVSRRDIEQILEEMGK